MTRHRRIVRVRQAELLEAAAAARELARPWRRAGRSRRTAPCASSARVTSSRIVPPISFAPRLCTTIGAVSGGSSPSSVSFASRHAWTRPCHCSASSFLPLLRDDALLDDLRERQIEVVAAEQQVIADGGAREAVAVRVDVDQREVGRAAADVEHEHALAGARALGRRSRRDRSTRRTRPAAPRAARPADSPACAAACSVSSRAASSNDAGHGDEHFLLGERRVGMLVVPRLADVPRAPAPARRPATASGRRCRPTAGSPRCDRRRGGTATTSPTRSCATPCARPGCARARRRPAAARRRRRLRIALARGAGRHGSAVSCGARSMSPARYTNDGSCRRGATSPGATSCGTSNTRTRGSAAAVSTYATAELVVPRSMPIRYRAGTECVLPCDG